MAAKTWKDLFDLAIAEALVRRPDLTFNEGDISEFIMAGGAAMADKVVHHGTELFRKTFIDGAEGDDLDQLLNDHFNLTRVAANQSIGSVQFERPSAGGGEPAGSITSGTTIATTFDAVGNQIQFTTDANVSFALGELGPKAVNITAVETGPAGNVAIGEISEFVDSVFDSNIFVTNTAITAGGDDEETDVQYRERAREFSATLRRGTIPALEFGAKQVAGVSVATVTEDLATSTVSVYVADSGGNSNAQMVSDVTTELENWRAAGISLNVSGGTLFTQAVDVSLTLKAGTDLETLRSDIEDAITDTLEKLGAGEVLRRTAIITAVKNVRIDRITEVTVNTPATDITPNNPFEVIRVGAITIT